MVSGKRGARQAMAAADDEIRFLAVCSGMPSVSFVRGPLGLGGIVVLSPARGGR